MMMTRGSFFAALCTLVASRSAVDAFAPSSSFHKQEVIARSSSSSASNTRLFISSFSKNKGAATVERVNPEENPAQSYLKEPEAVEARSNVDGTCLVSGLVNDRDRQTTDQFIFDLLNHEESAFEFSKIIAMVDDVAWAKKRLLSRSARYTGLLDKLDFSAATSAGALPTAEQLDGVKSWVAYVDKDHLAKLSEIGQLASQVSSVENVAVLLANANDLPATESESALEKIKQAATSGNFDYTIVVVGNLEEKPEGKEYYQYESFGTPEGVLPTDTTFSREESYRMVTELLQLACGKNKALCFAPIYNANVTEARLIRGLRQAGYARPQEIDHMIREGPEKYKEFVQKWKTDNPDVAQGYTTDAWWEQDIYQQSRRKSAEKEASKSQAAKDERTKEIEAIAKEWAKREYFRQSMAGTIPEGKTEEAFTEEVWERAMFEGDLKYRQAKGEVTDPDAELATFQAKQERKKKTMLQRAKDELAEILEEDGLSTDDLKKKWEEDEETMEDAGKKDLKGY